MYHTDLRSLGNTVKRVYHDSTQITMVTKFWHLQKSKNPTINNHKPDYKLNLNGLVQERHNSIANALELHLSCTNPSIWWLPSCQWSNPEEYGLMNHMNLYKNKRPVGLYSPLLIQIIQYCNKFLHVDASKTGWTPNKKGNQRYAFTAVFPTYSLTVLSKRPFSLKQEARQSN